MAAIMSKAEVITALTEMAQKIPHGNKYSQALNLALHHIKTCDAARRDDPPGRLGSIV